MFLAPYFNQRYFSATHFQGGVPTVVGALDHFNADMFKARYLAGTEHFSAEATEIVIPVVATSIAIELTPATVSRGSAVIVSAYVYDQYNKPMQGVRVDFSSSNSAVIATPSHAFTDATGRAVQTTTTSTAGTANLTARTSTLSAYTQVTVTTLVGGTVSTLTHGATIQMGNAGGGSPGPFKVKFTRRSRWPTR